MPGAHHEHDQQEAPMKAQAVSRPLAALLVGCCLRGGGPAGAEPIDFSKITCKQFLEAYSADASLILAWLDGFSHDEGDPQIFDPDAFAAKAKAFTAYCVAHPTVTLSVVADVIF
jgi:acid stress chaperone HdeB